MHDNGTLYFHQNPMTQWRSLTSYFYPEKEFPMHWIWLDFCLLLIIYCLVSLFCTNRYTGLTSLPVKGLNSKTYDWPLSTEGSLSCYIGCDTGPPLFSRLERQARNTEDLFSPGSPRNRLSEHDPKYDIDPTSGQFQVLLICVLGSGAVG